jgi:Ca2+-binding RTX toxin-like protein
MGHTIRSAVGVAAALAALLAAPALAAGAPTNVSINSSQSILTVRAAANSINVVQVSANLATGRIGVSDTASGVVTTDPVCTSPAAGIVTCPLGQLTKIVVRLNDLADRAEIGGSVPSSIPASLDGGPGNDQLFSASAADVLAGSSGNDFMDGGPGPDSFRGGSGNDTASYATRTTGVLAQIGVSNGSGGAPDGPPGGADTIWGDTENVIGGAAADFIVGSARANSLIGGDGDDSIYGKRGNDFIDGGPGSDFLVGNRENDRIVGGSGLDRLRGKLGFDRLFAVDGERDISLKCGPGRDRLFRDAIDPRGKSCKRRGR